MKKINVLKNGAEMPWTYYQADIINSATETDTTKQVEGKNRFMYTSESKPSASGVKDAGQHVSQIKRYVRFGNSSSLQPQVRNNPTIADYEEWGWPLEKDSNGNKILPKFGQFAFRPGMQPSYEDMSSISLTFKFGFGLNNTCYNFANENASVTVYNLSCKPKFFCTTNKFCDITYDQTTKKWGPDMTEELDGDKICCEAEEGTGDASNAYLLICVEAGEQLELTFPDNATNGANKEKSQIEIFGNDNVTGYEDSTSSTVTLNQPYRRNVEGDKYGEEAAFVGASIKYDFYRLRFHATNKYNSLKFNKEQLSINIKVAPKTYSTTLESFARCMNVCLNLKKSTSLPYIRHETGTDNGTGTTAIGLASHEDDSKEANRARLVVTAKEAIAYSSRTNGSYQKTHDQYHNSMLTEAEKNLDSYKKSIDKEDFIHYLLTDFSANVVTYLDQSNSDTSKPNALARDVSAILTNTAVQEAYAVFYQAGSNAGTNLKTGTKTANSVPTQQGLSLANIQSLPMLAGKFEAVVTAFKTDVLMPWNDSSCGDIRKLGKLWDVSRNEAETLDTGVNGAHNRDDTLLGTESTIATMLYSYCRSTRTGTRIGTDDLYNTYKSKFSNDADKDGTAVFTFTEMQKQFAMSYHGLDRTEHTLLQTETGMSQGHSRFRPAGDYQELRDYRVSLNPVEGISGGKYICEMLEFKVRNNNVTPNTSTLYYGLNALYGSIGKTPVKPNSDVVKALLYNGGLLTALNTAKCVVNTDFAASGVTVTITNPLLKNDTTGNNYLGRVFYVDKANETSDTYLGGHKGSNKNQFVRNLKDELNVANQELKNMGAYVLSTAGTDADAYKKDNWNKENCDISGVIRVPFAEDGCYFDVFVNGKEIKETVIDIEQSLYDNDLEVAAFDMSRTYCEYNTDISKNSLNFSTVKASRKTQLKSIERKLDITDAGIYSFFRLGNTIKFVANLEDLDSEVSPAMKFPTIKIVERGDVDGTCSKTYDNMYVPLRNVDSTLEPKVNYNRPKIASGYSTDDANANLDDNSGVIVSRWSSIYVPLDVSGELERGEEFQINLSNDKWYSDSTDVDLDDTAIGTFAARYAADATTIVTSDGLELPADCEAEKFVLQYQDREPGQVDIWRNAAGRIFKYECHNKSGTIATAAGGTKDSQGGSSNAYSASSNINGMPRFRLCLSSQNKLMNSFRQNQGNVSSSGTGDQVNGTIGRRVTLELYYTKSAKTTATGASMLGGNKKTTTASVIVMSDNYNPGIETQAASYATGEIELAAAIAIREDEAVISGSGHSLTGVSGAAGSVKVVGFNTTAGDDKQNCVPDYTKQVQYDFSGTWVDDLSGNSRRKFDIRNVEARENFTGYEAPIAVINMSNFYKVVNGQKMYAASAEIAPVFKYEIDEQEYAGTGRYCLQKHEAANSTLDITKDISGTAMARMIPANTHYKIEHNAARNEFRLIRTTPMNYEKWIGGNGDIYTENNFWNSTANEPLRELVNVKIVYHQPDSNADAYQDGSIGFGVREEANIIFLVKPKDVKEIKYNKEFKLTPADGDGEVDATQILSATIEGKQHDNIKYYVRGIIDASGVTQLWNSGAGELKDQTFAAKLATKEVKKNTHADRLNVTETNLTWDGANAVAANKKSISAFDLSNTDLKTLMVGDKLMLYHINHLVSDNDNMNSKFDAYERQAYRFYVEAVYDNDQQAAVENALTLVHVDVQHPSTGFYVHDTTAVEKMETLGTKAEGRTAAQNNPEIPLSTFLDKVHHEDLGQQNTANLLKKYTDSDVTFSILSIDDALQVTQPEDQFINRDFSNQIITLKDINSNKTTEKGDGSVGPLADYAHYNYERQTSYKLSLQACLSNKKEITVTKTPEVFLCGYGKTNVDNFQQIVGGGLNNKTADYLATFTIDPSSNTKAGEEYYFKNPSTGLYEGPLSVIPTGLQQILDGKQKKFGVDVRFAYVRMNTAPYTALYKAEGFRSDRTKPLKPDDQCVLPFEIIINNSFDEPKVCPQPYLLKPGQTYAKTNPAKADLINAADLTVKSNADNKVISYVYAEHAELHANAGKDLPGDFQKPEWSADYAAGGNNDTTARDRVIISALEMSATNTQYVNGLYTGNPDTEANGSKYYGKYQETSATDRVILDFFVETHGGIDSSGNNEDQTGNDFGAVLDNTGLTGNDIHSLETIKRSRNSGNEEQYPFYSTGALKKANIENNTSYEFTIVAVSNVLATMNDFKYNKNMVDSDQRYYEKTKMGPDGTTSTTAVNPQPFQKYVWSSGNVNDSSGGIITFGKALDNGQSVGESGPNPGTDGKGNFAGALLCCRSHFKVSINDNEDTGNSQTTVTYTCGKIQVQQVLNDTDNLKFNGGVIKAIMFDAENNIMIPLEEISASTGDIRLFGLPAGGDIMMCRFDGTNWKSLNH